ncbi:MAG: alpha/beta fold hydrolase [Deltaproteobacteria bacterium]|jgi:pimeloyl-[acyl-carrier protein] methyl ester esterase
MPFFETPSGVTIRYETRGAGPPLVFLHGWAMSGRVWRYQAELLASSFRIITMDLRGHGESSSTVTGRTIEDFAGDCVELFDRLDLHDATLTGWSMGAQVALRAFDRIGKRVAALVLVGGTPIFTATDDFPSALPPEEARGMAIRLRRNYAKTMNDFIDGMFAEGELSAESYQRIVREIFTGGRLPEPGVALKALDALVSSDLRPLLPEISVPVLLLHGERDTISLPDASRYMMAHLPHAVLQIMEGAGHAPFLSRPAEFNSLMSLFLEKVYGVD